MNKKIPKRRFKEFQNANAWEQRELGELSNIRRGASPRPISDPKWFSNESDIGWIRISDVTEQNGRIKNVEQKLSNLGIEKTLILDEGELILSIAASVGKPVINYIKTGIHDGFIVFLNPQFHRDFMFAWLERNQFIWNRYGQPGSQVNINSEIVKKQKVLLPNIKEQEKISNMILKFEDMITLHKRKFKKLKQLQKSYLSESVFSEPKCVPKRRFKGFIDEWEQKKLKNVVITNPYEELPEKFNYVNLESVLGTSLISYECTNIENAPSRAQRLAKKGDIFFQNVRPYQKNNLLFNLDCSNYVFSTGYTQLRPKLNSGFLFSIIQKDKFVNKVLNRCTGSSYPAISSKDLVDIKVNISRNIEEQNKIADFIGTIDKLLTLHKNKRDTIQKLQKIYLQNNLEDETYA